MVSLQNYLGFALTLEFDFFQEDVLQNDIFFLKFYYFLSTPNLNEIIL